jgi:putative endonuclease
MHKEMIRLIIKYIVMQSKYYVYILTNKRNTVLYVGVTNNLERRYFEHLIKLNNGFTQKYNLNKLIFFQEFESNYEAILMEKKVKGWVRKKKEELINYNNPGWDNLMPNIDTGARSFDSSG